MQLSKRFAAFALMSAVAIFTSGGAFAYVVVWDGETSQDMSTGTNWAGDATPAAADQAVLDDGTLSLMPRLDSNNALTFSGTSISAGTMTIDGDLTSSTVSITGPGSMVVSLGGSLAGDVTNSGTFTLGGTLIGSLSTSGRLSVPVDATGMPLFVLQANALNLGGVLALNLLGLGYDSDSISIDLFQAQTINGDFASLDLVGLNAAYGFSTSIIDGAGSNDDVFRLVLTRAGTVPVPGTGLLVGIALAALLASRRRA